MRRLIADMGSAMEVTTIPLLKDNYAYVITHENECVIVDPSESEPLLRMGLQPTQIWCTHHHADHTGGVEALCAAFPGVRVVASAYDREKARVWGQNAEAPLPLASSLPVQMLEVPGHTLGAVAYLVGDALFTGDTLFLAGCGRLFEGTAAQMWASLQKLAALPPETRVFCGHEYTENNLRFAVSVEPNNAAVATRLAGLSANPTVPGTIAEERATNLFMRAQDAAALAELRQKKDIF
jgi:hydroxyacylglutathione hydrolase